MERDEMLQDLFTCRHLFDLGFIRSRLYIFEFPILKIFAYKVENRQELDTDDITQTVRAWYLRNRTICDLLQICVINSPLFPLLSPESVCILHIFLQNRN